jgi:hypothetical protein
MKHKTPQFDLPMMETVFNLSGETIRASEEKPIVRDDNTAELFANDCKHKMICRATQDRFEVIGAKNPNAAKYAAAKQRGGKPSDYAWNWKAE